MSAAGSDERNVHRISSQMAWACAQTMGQRSSNSDIQCINLAVRIQSVDMTVRTFTFTSHTSEAVHLEDIVVVPTGWNRGNRDPDARTSGLRTQEAISIAHADVSKRLQVLSWAPRLTLPEHRLRCTIPLLKV